MIQGRIQVLTLTKLGDLKNQLLKDPLILANLN